MHYSTSNAGIMQHNAVGYGTTKEGTLANARCVQERIAAPPEG
jgi:hypothetical protein